jgi:uncharacterized protein (TIGR02246 family)
VLVELVAEDDMRTAVLIFCALTIPGSVMGQTSRVSADEIAARRVVERLEEARHRGDWKATAALFTEDADQLTSAGEWRHGPDEIAKGGATGWAANYTGTGATYTGRVDTVRILHPTVVVVNGTFEITNIGGAGARRGYTTFVVVRRGDRWLIDVARWMVPTNHGALPPR